MLAGCGSAPLIDFVSQIKFRGGVRNTVDTAGVKKGGLLAIEVAVIDDDNLEIAPA